MQAVETTAAETTAVGTKKDRGPRNGVDTPKLFATLDAVRAQPELAQFQFRVTNRWISGTNSRSRMEPFKGAGTELAHKRTFEYDADHHEALVGTGEGPTPIEFLLHGLAPEVRNGYQKIRATFDIKGDAPAEKLREIVEQSRARSAVFDVLTSGVPVEVAVNAA
jgi:uncharacterized OsmC-like protein